MPPDADDLFRILFWSWSVVVEFFVQAVGGKRRRPATTRGDAFRRAMELNIILSISISMCFSSRG